MTRRLSLVTLLFAVSAFGAVRPETVVSGFYVMPSEGERGFGAAIEYSWTPHLSAYVAVSEEPTAVTKFVPSAIGNVPTTSFDDLHPVDLLVRYHHSAGSRLRPYAGVGMRYIRSGSIDNYRPELNAGLRFALTQRISIAADWKHLYNRRTPKFMEPVRDGEFGESAARLALGLGWTF